MFLNHQIETAIKRLKEFEPEEGYYLAFSGGKDSVVIKQLAIESGVKFDAHYNDTTIDPPELRLFIKHNHKDVEWHKPEVPFLVELVNRGFPNRFMRWCCDVYKENGGHNRRVITGVRWAESVKRSKRKMIEQCYRKKTRTFLNVIIDWSSNDVWDFINNRGLPYCSLYDEGWTRIGCLLCPCANQNSRLKEASRYPNMTKGFKKAFIKLYEKNIIERPAAYSRWSSGEEMFDWWLSTPNLKEEDVDENQIMLFE